MSVAGFLSPLVALQASDGHLWKRAGSGSGLEAYWLTIAGQLLYETCSRARTMPLNGFLPGLSIDNFRYLQVRVEGGHPLHASARLDGLAGAGAQRNEISS